MNHILTQKFNQLKKGHRPYQYINRRRSGWLRRAWDMGIIHSVAGMIVLAAIVAIVIVMAGIYQPEPPRINDRAPALEKIMEVVK